MLNDVIDIHQGFYPYGIPPFLGLLTTLGLALLAFIKGRGKKINILFACMCTIGIFFNIDLTLRTVIKKADFILAISRLDHILLVFNIPLYLHIVYSILSVKKMKWLVPLAYIFSFVLMLFTQSRFYLPDIQEYYFGFCPEGGPLFYLFISVNFLASLYCLSLLYHGMREERDLVKRNKIKYIFLGFGVYAILAMSNVFSMKGMGIYPLGNFGFIPTIILAFGVLKHDLLDMGFLIRKGMIYSCLTGLLTGLYALSIVSFGFVFKGTEIAGSFLFYVFLFLIIVFIFTPMKEKVQLAIDRVFFKEKYDYQRTIKDVSQAMTSILDMKEIVNRIIDTVRNSMRVSTVSVALRNKNKGGFLIQGAKGDSSEEIINSHFKMESPLITLLLEQKTEIFRHDIEEGSLCSMNKAQCLKEFDFLNASMIIPMIFKESVSGFISLGHKKSGDLYTSDDLELLQTLANQSSISIENARSYRMIEELNENLEKKIQARTIELERALLEKERTQEQLIRSESLAAVGQLVAGVAHELNNPLASVSSLVQSTVESLEEMDEKAEYEAEIIDDLQFTLKELQRAKEIVGSLLDISRQTEVYTEPINMNMVVKDALRVLYNQYKNYDLEIVEDFQDELPVIKGNFAHLGQVCLNIIKNSIQEVKENGGKITLRTRFDQGRERIVFECVDTGKGIPKSIINNIFKPFFTTKEVGRGTGLGLYISYEIVKRHNGDIFVSSAQGEGTKFRVELPLN
ncbi:MAG: ATP-binding protein [Thermodesulfobacteriota bacterium]|nr:ATP-binding protein [Thermodesulfobacteriota bacterium]